MKTREGFVLTRTIRGSLGMRGHLIEDKRGEKMSHRVFQIRKVADAKAEMIAGPSHFGEPGNRHP